MYKLGDTLRFEFDLFSVTGEPLSGASATVNVWNPSKSLVVSGGAATQAEDGGFYYEYVSNAVGRWKAKIFTTDEDVDVNGVPCYLDVVPVDYFGGDTSPIETQLDTIEGKVDDLTEDVYDLTHAPDGTPISIVIPPPSGDHTCRVWEWCYNTAGNAPVDTVDGEARIVSLPYNYGGVLHSGDVVEFQYGIHPDNGLKYWFVDLPWYASVAITLNKFGVLHHVTVPEASDIRAATLLDL